MSRVGPLIAMARDAGLYSQAQAEDVSARIEGALERLRSGETTSEQFLAEVRSWHPKVRPWC